MIPRTLFLKIFLWFWLAASIIIGVFYLMIRISFAERLRGSYGEGLALYAEVAARAYDHDGIKAFEELATRSQQESGTEIYLFDANGHPLGSPGDENVIGVLHEIQQQSAQERIYHLVSGRVTWGKAVTTPDGKRYVFVAHLSSPSLGPSRFFSPLRIAVSLLIAGVGCYLLALYLTSPLKKLRRTVQAFAEGNLDVRIAPQLGNRRDELADLGREFDHMAERIAALISAQQRLLADISHELRSPLARLSVALELARKSGNGTSVTALDRIEKEAERLNLLVGQLLALTRLESGAERVPPEIVVLEELVQQVIDDGNFEAKPLHKEVRAVALEHCRVLGSAELLRSAVENVIRNAVRYTTPGSAVEVSLQWKLDTAVFTVRDHGPGVPEAELEHIFEPFYRVSEARERSSGGAGLGLSIADRTVKLHGGSIVAANSSPGLLVTIQLPLAPSLSSNQSPAPSAFAPVSSTSG